jgi:tetratricopeptide (TPR) repeat protein
MTDSRVSRRNWSGLKSIILTFFILAAGMGSVDANDGAGPAMLAVDQQYFHRDKGSNLNDSITALNAWIHEADKGEPTATFLWMRCRSFVRRGEKREKKADKLTDYALAQADCEKSVALNAQSADGHFWYGVAMGRWGETKGILKAMFLIKPIRREMNETLKLDPKHGGAHHVLGEMLWQIPGFAGGDKKKAIEEFELAVKLSPAHTSNYQPLAEAYLHFDRKGDAIKTLQAVAAIKEPADPAEYAENLADANKLLATLTAK